MTYTRGAVSRRRAAPRPMTSPNERRAVGRRGGRGWAALITMGMRWGFRAVTCMWGGWFTTAGGGAANYIAKWDGSSWTALGSGMDDYVFALAVLGSDLYAGGFFTTAGGSVALGIAKWNGSSWTALGSGMNSEVHALAISGNDL